MNFKLTKRQTKIWNYFKNSVLLIVVSTIFLSSLMNILESNPKAKNFIKAYFLDKSGSQISFNEKKLAKEILNGNYILHFRHTEREKWLDVGMYDAIETSPKNGNIYNFGENQYFENAVCLNSKGKIQAKAMSEVIKKAGLNYSKVISSPSCRARQTAEIVFGGYDELNKIVVYKGPYNENKHEYRKKLEKYYVKLNPKNQNIIISSHRAVIHGDIFENYEGPVNMDEGGFAVIEVKGKKLYLKGIFKSFRDFKHVFYFR